MWRWILAGIVAFGACLTLGIRQPLLLVAGLSAAVAINYSYFLVPKEKMIGWMAAFALAMVILFPIHLVPSALRYAELGILVLFTVITMLHRGFILRGWVPALTLAYLVITWVSTDAAGIEGAEFQFIMHAVTGVSFLVMGAKSNEGERKTIIRTIIQLGAFQALYSLYEYIAQPAVLWASPVPEKWEWMASRLANEILTGGLRSQGTFGHPLLLSFVLIVALALTLRYPFKGTALRFGLVALFLCSAVAVGSRSAAIIMAALALFTYGMSKLAWVRGVFLSAAGLLMLVTSSFLASDVVRRFTESGSLSHRQGALDAVPRLLSEQSSFQVLFGNGWYSTQTVYDRGLLQLDGFVAIDNQFVALLVTTGVAGVGIFLVLLAICFKVADRDVRPALLGAAVVFLVFDILEFPGTWGIFAILMGLTTMGVAWKMDPANREAAPRKQHLPDWAARHPELVRRSAE